MWTLQTAHLGKGQNPWKSVVFVGIVAMLVAAFAPFRVAVAVSSFGTLLYYTVTSASASGSFLQA